jgi:adenine-specific DNA-methyltransferase
MIRAEDITVIHGDCREVLGGFSAKTFNFVLTDPPALGDSLKAAFAEIYRTLRDDSYCVSFYDWSHVREFMEAWQSAGFRPAAQFVWRKPYPSAENVVRCRHEQAYLLAKGNFLSRHARPNEAAVVYRFRSIHRSQS